MKTYVCDFSHALIDENGNYIANTSEPAIEAAEMTNEKTTSTPAFGSFAEAIESCKAARHANSPIVVVGSTKDFNIDDCHLYVAIEGPKVSVYRNTYGARTLFVLDAVSENCTLESLAHLLGSSMMPNIVVYSGMPSDLEQGEKAIRAKFESKCSRTGAKIAKGQWIAYNAVTKKARAIWR
jgi:methyl coenzyme M reductase subunit C-like uncharacterized protein (methanogenesis marker protein 7)